MAMLTSTSAMSVLASNVSLGASYQLQVIGGNTMIHGTALCEMPERHLATCSTHGLVPCRAGFIERAGSRYLALRDSTAEDDARYCTLRGPVGKGEYQIAIESQLERSSALIGVSVFSSGWIVVEDHGRNLLRFDKDLNSSRWIAVPDADSGAWVPWWYAPSAANLEDFDNYVTIDIELVEVSQ
ncbi:hypothetical protein PV08_08118 [Exophiala spinifera]|uniref:Uncharacterized protein n=1 Tax=Exophiala spinifera TaxID=91928 RepID=A0A0D1YDA0_9EURO|nr:uncharacterized protein PV08_08118 [Exophiala spinifera]KIW12931.1 hypothetical protein PV08_08118 [Exophiala spinifera]